MEWEFGPVDVVKGAVGYTLAQFRRDLAHELRANLETSGEDEFQRAYGVVYDLCYWLATGRSLPDAIELMSTKVGLVIVVLGLMHFFNMFTLMRFRRSALFRALEPRHMHAQPFAHYGNPGHFPMPPVPQPVQPAATPQPSVG